jgi:hypothetical protein
VLSAGFIFSERKMRQPTCIDTVRRAFELWQEAGEPEGRDWGFHLRAERELQEALDNDTPEDTK